MQMLSWVQVVIIMNLVKKSSRLQLVQSTNPENLKNIHDFLPEIHE